MKVFVWQFCDGLTTNWHDGGGVTVFARDLGLRVVERVQGRLQLQCVHLGPGLHGFGRGVWGKGVHFLGCRLLLNKGLWDAFESHACRRSSVGRAPLCQGGGSPVQIGNLNVAGSIPVAHFMEQEELRIVRGFLDWLYSKGVVVCTVQDGQFDDVYVPVPKGHIISAFIGDQPKQYEKAKVLVRKIEI